MLLKFGAACRSRAERLGTLHGVAIEPLEKLLLKLVVEDERADPLVRVRIAFGRVDNADADQVVLGMTVDEFQALRGAELEGGKRGAATRRRRGDEPHERVLTARSRVECRDGDVGVLSGILVDSRTGDLEGLVVPMGITMLREVVIPSEQVGDIRDDRVGLNCDMNDLAENPSLRT